MTNTRTSAAPILTNAEVGELLVKPVVNLCQAANVATTVSTANSFYRLPMVNRDPRAAWLNEGDEIPATDAELAEIDVYFSKIAGLSVVTNELASDSSPQATEEIGKGLARDIAMKLDAAFFGALPAPSPAGLDSLKNVATVDASSGLTNLDAFLEAQSNAETLGTSVTSFVAHPSDALTLAKMKASTTPGSNVALLGTDPTQPTRRMIGGVPLYVSAGVTPGEIWAIPQDRVTIVVRQDATVESDKSVYFTSDRVAVRAVMRVGFAFAQPEAITKIVTKAPATK